MTRRARAYSTGLAVAIGVAAGPSVTSAQEPQRLDSATASCLAAISPSSLHEARVFVVEDSTNGWAPAAMAVADSFTRSLTAELRTVLGALPNKVSPGEPRITWRDVGGSMRATVHKDGRATLDADSIRQGYPMWYDAVVRSDSVSGVPRTKSIGLLADAFEALKEGKTYRIPWPTELKADSITFHLSYHVAEIDSLGYLEPSRYRIMFPAFRLGVPTVHPVSPKRPIKLDYPSAASRSAVEGTVHLTFVVDKYGRVVPESIQSNWPSDRPRPTGSLGSSYDAFVRTGKEAVLKAEFRPATIGGCAVAQRVTQPFQFVLRH